jgi:hypothetical protein
VFIGLGLLIFPLWGAFSGWPSVTAIFGYGFIFVACAYSLYYFRNQLKIGSLWLFVPLLVLLFLALLRFAVGHEAIDDKVLLSSYLLLMIAFYFTAKQKGESLLWFVIPAVVLYSINAIVDAGLHPGIRAHGLSTNCDTLASMLVFCVFALRGKWVWLAPLAITAIMLTGSYWALGALVVTGIVYIILERKKFRWFNRMMGVTVMVVVVLIVFTVAGFSTGIAQKIWNTERVESILQAGAPSAVVENFDKQTARLSYYKYAIDTFSWLGNGGSDSKILLPEFNETKLHNTPAMILHSLGPFALIAWLVTMGYGIYKSKKYRYLLIAIFLAGLIGSYDFWHWSSLGSYYFLAIGLVGNELSVKG